MGDISKAKHASSNTLVRGKHAKHARVVENTHPSRVRYAAGTFLVSSAIALGLFAVLPFSASETVDAGETQTASATQENLLTKSAQATQKNVGSSAQNSPLVQSQSTNDSDNQEATAADSSATDSEESTPESNAEVESPNENSADQVLENQEESEATSEDGASDNTDIADAEASNEQSSENADEPSAPTSSDSVSEPSSKSDSEAAIIDGSSNPSSLIASMVSNYDPDAVESNIAFFQTVIEDKKPIAKDEAQKLAENPVNYVSLVEPQLQQGVLDSGCEIFSLSMALESMGIKADPVDIAEGYLDFEGGMADGFVGSPYEGGAGFPAGIAKAANAYLKDIGSDRHAYDLTGNSFDTIAGLVSRGYPVLIWTTIDFSEPFFHDVVEGDYQWYGNEHCVLLCGVSDDIVVVCDPLEGLIERDTEQFIEIYEQCGSMALYVR